MDDSRKFEIAYLLLKQQLKEDGVALNVRFKGRLDNASRTLGIPDREIEEFAVLITRDVYGPTETYPPISPRTKVRTTTAKSSGWTPDATANRKWGVEGEVITHHDSHGLYYDVQHTDGTVGCYEPSELDILKD